MIAKQWPRDKEPGTRRMNTTIQYAHVRAFSVCYFAFRSASSKRTERSFETPSAPIVTP